jgi:hypothetical protein
MVGARRRALRAAILHEEYLKTGDVGVAERADAHYLMALSLMGHNPRFRAMVLGELGLLHTDVGNYRIALGYLLDRDKLPYSDDVAGFDVLLSKAQALLHVGRDVDAATAGEKALAMVAKTPRLAPYRLLALDWAALDGLSSGKFDRALALYDEEIPLLDPSGDREAVRDRFVVHVARAAAAVGAKQPLRAIADLDFVDGQLADGRVVATLVWPHGTEDRVARTYRLMASGLRAGANRELGRLDGEARARETRQAILAARLRETGRAEVARSEMLEDAQLAWNAGEREDKASARKWIGMALRRADELRTQSEGKIEKGSLDVLWLAAALSASMNEALVGDLAKRLDAALADIAAQKEPTLRAYPRRFEMYAPLFLPANGAR